MYELNVLKSTEPDGFHPGVLKGIMDVTARPLSVIHHPVSWKSGKVPAGWKPANVISVYKDGIRNSENYRPVTFKRNFVEDHTGPVEMHLKDNAMVKLGQHGFTKGKGCLPCRGI